MELVQVVVVVVMVVAFAWCLLLLSVPRRMMSASLMSSSSPLRQVHDVVPFVEACCTLYSFCLLPSSLLYSFAFFQNCKLKSEQEYIYIDIDMVVVLYVGRLL